MLSLRHKAQELLIKSHILLLSAAQWIEEKCFLYAFHVEVVLKRCRHPAVPTRDAEKHREHNNAPARSLFNTISDVNGCFIASFSHVAQRRKEMNAASR